MEYYSATKRTYPLIYTMTQIKLKMMMLRKRVTFKKYILYDFLYIKF